MVTLASATMPLFKPKPTPAKERIAPPADIDSRVFLPSLCTRSLVIDQRTKKETHSYLNKEDGWEGHCDVHDGNAKGNIRTEVGEGFC